MTSPKNVNPLSKGGSGSGKARNSVNPKLMKSSSANNKRGSPPKNKKGVGNNKSKQPQPQSNSNNTNIFDKIKKDLKNNVKLDKKTIMTNLPFLLFAFVGNKFAYAWNSTKDINLFMKQINATLLNPMPSFAINDILVGVALAVGIKLMLYSKKKKAKKFRDKEEYGSARWGNDKDIAPYTNLDNFKDNIVLTKTESLTMESRPSSGIQYARNKNILVVGGSGSGKTRFFVKPNLMQMHSSYVVTDPKGTVLNEVGSMLEKNGYEIRTINTINFKKSMHYNPFAYISNEDDILKLVNTIIANTKGDGDKGGEDFWVKAERLLYCAYIGFIFYELPKHQHNFNTLVDMINMSETSEDDETFKNRIDLTFEALEEFDPEHFAVRQFKKYKLAAGKTAKSILISCGARLAPFDIQALREMMEYDEMNLQNLGEKKTALFVIVSDNDNTYNFVVAMLYTQLFNVLCTIADDVHGGRLPVHVRCLLDEFANLGQIPNFEKLIATIRSREISASIILQSKSQLKAIYKDNADTIVGNCDTMLFLGGNEKSTLKDLSETLGKQTIDLYNTSENRGQSQSYGLNYNKTGRELMSQDELAVMDGGKCILQIRGVRPFFSDKFDITKHTKYGLLSDSDKDNTFRVEEYMKRMRHRVQIKNDEKIEESIIIKSDKVDEILSSEEEKNN